MCIPEIVEGDNDIFNLRSSETYGLLKVKILFTKYFATPLFKQIKVVCVDNRVVLLQSQSVCCVVITFYCWSFIVLEFCQTTLCFFLPFIVHTYWYVSEQLYCLHIQPLFA
jgi:hypothetical protein